MTLASEERKVGIVQLVVDAILDNILQNRCPARHLVGLLIDAVLPFDLPNSLAVSLKIIPKHFLTDIEIPNFESIKSLKKSLTIFSVTFSYFFAKFLS